MRNFLTLFTLVLMSIAFGCSSAENITSPTGSLPDSSGNLPEVWAAFSSNWDGVSDTMTITPDRDLAAHFNVKAYLYPSYLSLSVLSWDPATRVMTVRLTIENPTNLDVYDVRTILMRLGDKKLLNADDYTKLFDTNTPPVANPFRAYAKDEPGRKLAGRYSTPDKYRKAETFEIYFPSDFVVYYIVTASYPTNCDEPYDIVDIQQSGTLYESSGSLDILAEVLDWKNTTASKVVIEANPVTLTNVDMSVLDPTHWTASLLNTGGALAGKYPVWVAAYDSLVPYALYNTFTITIEPDTTSWSFHDNFSPSSTHVWTSYGGNWWGKLNGYMDASGGTDGNGECYEEDNGSIDENLNLSYVASPQITVPISNKNLVLTMSHYIDVDPPEELARFAWDMCYVRINGVPVSPTSGPAYEHNHYPWTYDDIFCWTGEYQQTQSVFNLGTQYNGTTIRIEFVCDTFDYIDNCKPLNNGWQIDDVLLDLQ